MDRRKFLRLMFYSLLGSAMPNVSYAKNHFFPGLKISIPLARNQKIVDHGAIDDMVLFLKEQYTASGDIATDQFLEEKGLGHWQHPDTNGGLTIIKYTEYITTLHLCHKPNSRPLDNIFFISHEEFHAIEYFNQANMVENDMKETLDRKVTLSNYNEETRADIAGFYAPLKHGYSKNEIFMLLMEMNCITHEMQKTYIAQELDLLIIS